MDEKTFTATLTSNGRVTIPIAVRRHLDLCPGAKVTFALDDDGKVMVQRGYTLDEVMGSGPPLPDREPGDLNDLMREAMEDIAEEKVQQLNRATLLQETEANVPSVLPPQEAHALFDAQARRYAGVSGKEFLRRWDAGEYRDVPDTEEGRRIMYVVYLMPFGRQ